MGARERLFMVSPGPAQIRGFVPSPRTVFVAVFAIVFEEVFRTIATEATPIKDYLMGVGVSQLEAQIFTYIFFGLLYFADGTAIFLINKFWDRSKTVGGDRFATLGALTIIGILFLNGYVFSIALPENPRTQIGSAIGGLVRPPTPTPAPQWQNSVSKIDEFHQAINNGEYSRAYDIEDSSYHKGLLDDFVAFWTPYRVGYVLYGCDTNEVETLRIFYHRSDYGYFSPIKNSEEIVHIWLGLGEEGDYRIVESAIYPQVSQSCEYALEFQAQDLEAQR